MTRDLSVSKQNALDLLVLDLLIWDQMIFNLLVFELNGPNLFIPESNGLRPFCPQRPIVPGLLVPLTNGLQINPSPNKIVYNLNGYQAKWPSILIFWLKCIYSAQFKICLSAMKSLDLLNFHNYWDTKVCCINAEYV